MHFYQGVILFLAALAAGAINSVAGGGSFLSFPSLLLIGIPPVNANATSTVALWPGQPASVWAYRREIRDIPASHICSLDDHGNYWRHRWRLRVADHTSGYLHEPGALAVAGGDPDLHIERPSDALGWSAPRAATCGIHVGSRHRPTASLAFYLGYFGAGAGILLLATLALLGMDNIHAMNALKAWLTAVSNGVAMLLFIYHRAVYWPEAIVMVVGSVLGGYFGAYFAQKTKPSHVRLIVIVIGFGMTAYFFARQIWH